MKLRTVILATLSYDGLKRAARDVQLQGWERVDFRSRASLRAALSASTNATAARLLPFLSDEELAAVCQSMRVPAGPRRDRIFEDLLQAARQPRLPQRRRRRFVAIDFETADYGRDSACAVALVRVEGEEIVDRRYHLIRPPRREFVFSDLHGITWRQVESAPAFRELWPQLTSVLRDVEFLAAHNAPFDRSVLNACCAAAGLAPPTIPFLCTVRLARETWSLYPTKLPNVCGHLGIPLNHHHAASDAEACARIVMAAGKQRPAAATA